ncbi:hypothetical protein [Stenotrophomonas maltophilia]|nr:hypothetical protein [Stenotrophomonas maltophilia]
MSTKVDTYRRVLRAAVAWYGPPGAVLVAADLGQRFECVSTKVDTYR